MVDARILQRLDYPEYVIEVDRAKARTVGLTQEGVMKNVISALNSSIQFNKKNFWIDPKSQNQYFVGVQYPEDDIKSLETVLNVSITSPVQNQAVPLSNFVTLKAASIAAEVTHDNLQSAIDLEMNVHGRDLGHVADDIERLLNQFGRPQKKSFGSSIGQQEQTGAIWLPFDPEDPSHQKLMAGTKMKLSGEYGHMTNTFTQFGIGLTLAVVFVYFLMVALLDSYIVPLLDHVCGAAGPARHHPHAVSDGHGDQRAIALGRDLRGRHHRVAQGAADRLRREASSVRRS